MFKVFFTLILLIGLSVSKAHTQPTLLVHPLQRNATLAQWEVVDIGFKPRKQPAGHPESLQFGAVFTGPDGQQLKIPGFYKGAQQWCVRFSAPQQGTWVYETFSSYPELAGLRGSMVVSKPPRRGQHGAVGIDPANPRKFIYEDGTPYFALAFEIDWLFALDADNPHGIPKTQQILQTVQENGFNQVVMNVYAYDVGWQKDASVPAKYEFRKPPYTVFEGTNENPVFNVLNSAFFNHFDRVIHELDQRGIIAHLMIYVWNKQVNWPAMNSVTDNQYFDHIIARYQAYPNVIWDISKEALDYGRCDIPYITERIARVRKQDAYQRLVTVHDYEYCSREPGKVDFISIQSWRSHLYPLMLEAVQRHADKPVMNIEHGGYEVGPFLSFEGNYDDPKVCLIRNYLCIFAGVYSTYYWQNTSWNIVIYDALQPEAPLPKPVFPYYKHMATLFAKYDFNQLFPVFAKITTNNRVGADNLSSNGYPLTNGSNLHLYLLPDDCKNLNVVLPRPDKGAWNVTWFNPFTGEFLDKGRENWKDTWQTFVSPWPRQYSILVLSE
jgi:hypothetical protein